LGKFILDHFKVVAIIDFAIRLFDALASTCIILLEKCSNEEERKRNEIVFIKIPGEVISVSVDELLEIIERRASDKYYVKVVRQGDMSRDKKWLAIFIGKEIFQSNLLTKMEELFTPSYGNLTYLYRVSTGELHGVRNPGSSGFHYLSPSRIRELGLERYVNDADIIFPALTSAEYAKFFTFTKDDWGELKRDDKNVTCSSGMLEGGRRLRRLRNT
jgi:hypothetical protein